MPRTATAVLPHHHNSMLSWLQRLSEMTKSAVGRNIGNRLTVHNQCRARFGLADNLCHSSMKLVAGYLEDHVLGFALGHQGESVNDHQFAGLFLALRARHVPELTAGRQPRTPPAR